MFPITVSSSPCALFDNPYSISLEKARINFQDLPPIDFNALNLQFLDFMMGSMNTPRIETTQALIPSHGKFWHL